MNDRLKIGQEVLIHGYVDEIRKDTIIIQNEGGYFGTVECEVTDIEMLDTNEVLDKIRAEIDKQIKYNTYFNSDMAKGEIIAFEWVKRKIDEYTKGEGE